MKICDNCGERNWTITKKGTKRICYSCGQPLSEKPLINPVKGEKMMNSDGYRRGKIPDSDEISY